jgi:WD40 repeat protein
LLVCSGQWTVGSKTTPASSLPTAHSALPTLKILDMGLARIGRAEDEESESSSTLTQEGSVMGTLDYIAPEQATDSHSVDIRAVLYSLGCTLYYLLTGRVPFPGGDALAKLMKHKTEEPRPIEQLRPEVPPPLASIIRTLMAKQPEARYRTPAQLVAALDEAAAAVAAGSWTAVPSTPMPPPTQAGAQVAQQWAEIVRDGSATEAIAKVPKIEPAAVPWRYFGGAGAAAVLMLVLIWQPWRGGSVKDETKADPSAVEPSTDAVAPPPVAGDEELSGEQRRVAANKALKPLSMKAQKLARGAKHLAVPLRDELRALLTQHAGTPAARQASALLGAVLAEIPSPLDKLDPAKVPDDVKAFWRARDLEFPSELVGVLGESRRRLWSSGFFTGFLADGAMIAHGGVNNWLWLWNPETGEERPVGLNFEHPIRCLALSPDGKVLAAGTRGYPTSVEVKLFDPRSGKELAALKPPIEAASLGFSPDSKTLYAFSLAGKLHAWDSTTGAATLTADLRAAANRHHPFAIAPDGKTLLVAYVAGWSENEGAAVLKRWQPETGEERLLLKHRADGVSGVVLSPDGKNLALPLAVRKFMLVDAATGQIKHTLPGDGPVLFTADSRTLITASGQFIDVDSGKVIQHLSFYGPPALSADGQRVAAAGSHGLIACWDIQSGKEIQPVTDWIWPLSSFAFSPHDDEILTGGNVIRLWDPLTPRQKAAFVGHQAWYLPGNRGYLSYRSDGIMRLHDQQGNVQRQIGKTTVAMLAPNGKLAALVDGAALELGDPEQTAPLHRLTGLEGRPSAMAFSFDSARIVASHGNGRRIWNTATGKTALTIAEDRPCINMAFSPDGMRVIFANYDAQVTIRDARTGVLIETLLVKSCRNPIRVALSPDGKTMAITGSNGGFELWELPDAAPARQLQSWSLPGAILDACFAHDGRHLATLNANATVYIFRLPKRAAGFPDPV